MDNQVLSFSTKAAQASATVSWGSTHIAICIEYMRTITRSPSLYYYALINSYGQLSYGEKIIFVWLQLRPNPKRPAVHTHEPCPLAATSNKYFWSLWKHVALQGICEFYAVVLPTRRCLIFVTVQLLPRLYWEQRSTRPSVRLNRHKNGVFYVCSPFKAVCG